MKNVFITFICVVVACTFINMYMNNKILETSIILNDKQAMPAAGNTETFMSETIYYPTSDTDIEKPETEESLENIPEGATVITEDDVTIKTDENSTTVTYTKTEDEKESEKIDVGGLLEEMTFTDKMFLTKTLIKIGGLDTLEKLMAGDEKTLAGVKSILSEEELSELQRLYTKYEHLLGNFELPNLNEIDTEKSEN